MKIMTPEHERDFKALVMAEPHLCEWYNKSCNGLYKDILHIHRGNRPIDDKARVTPLGDWRVVGWLISDIKLMDGSPLQLLEKMGRRNEHDRICFLFAMATFDGLCSYDCG